MVLVVENKYPWYPEWKKYQGEVLSNLNSPFPNSEETLTITTLDQLPGVDTRTTFSFESVGQARDAFAGKNDRDIYLRLTSPTIRSLENMITLLEARHFFGDLGVPERMEILSNAPVKSLVFSCGMAAISHTHLALLNWGDTMITDKVLYGCSDNLLNVELPNKGIHVVEVDASDLDQIRAAFQKNPGAKLIYFETPANPTLGIRDIKAISEIAKKYRALVVVDNTFATPCLQNPLRHGADIVVHSLTKFANGHGDVLGGSVTGPATFISGNCPGGLFYARRIYGGVMDPGAVASILKGITTLSLRMERHCDNAEKVVEFLNGHPKVKTLHYPGLAQRGIAAKQMRRYGGMVAFEYAGSMAEAEEAMNKITSQEVGYLAVSLGLPPTLIDFPAAMTHFFVLPEERLKKGITDTLIRVSVGLENPGKIIDMFRNILGDR